MRRSLAISVFILLVAVAAPASAFLIIFTVKTDYSPQVDFDAIRVRIARSDGSDPHQVAVPVFEASPVLTGVKVDLDGVGGGDWTAIVSLLDAGGSPIDERGVLIDNITGDTALTPIVVAMPRLRSSKTWALVVDHEEDGVPTPGDVVRYTVEADNATGSLAQGMSYIDEVAEDQNLALVIGSVTTTHGTVARGNSGPSDTVVVIFGDIAAGESATIEYDAVVGASRAVNQGEVLAFNVPGFRRSDDPETDPFDATRVPISLAGVEAARGDLSDALDRVDECEGELGEAEGELGDLRAELADPDGDGVPAVSDACSDTLPAEGVDSEGCSLSQFCSAIATAGTGGPARCNGADWSNDDPTGSGDCRHRRGRCVPR